MASVYVLHHEYERLGKEDVKFIGVYASRSDGEAAIERLRGQPGFSWSPEGFSLDEYELNKDHWEEGFFVSVNINVRLFGDGDPVWYCVEGYWRPGDVYEIGKNSTETNIDRWEFKPGQVVRCEEREIDGAPGCLFAVAAV